MNPNETPPAQAGEREEPLDSFLHSLQIAAKEHSQGAYVNMLWLTQYVRSQQDRIRELEQEKAQLREVWRDYIGYECVGSICNVENCTHHYARWKLSNLCS